MLIKKKYHSIDKHTQTIEVINKNSIKMLSTFTTKMYNQLVS